MKAWIVKEAAWSEDDKRLFTETVGVVLDSAQLNDVMRERFTVCTKGICGPLPEDFEMAILPSDAYDMIVLFSDAGMSLDRVGYKIWYEETDVLDDSLIVVT